MPSPVPAHYRSELCTRILKTVVRGDSCTMIGVGSSGKSNVARHLARRDAREHNLKMEVLGMVGVLVDCLNYLEPTTVSLHRLIIESLIKAAERDDAPTEFARLAPEFKTLWEQATETDSPDRVRYYLSQAVDLPFKNGTEKLFFILDDFDKVMKTAPAAALNSLRSLRDNHKGQLAYVVVMRREMVHLRPDVQEYEDFHELVAKPVFPVGAYDGDDVQEMIDRLLPEGREMSRSERERLIAFSGGHAGLLKTIYKAAEQNSVSLMSGDALHRLRNRNDVFVECQKMWDSLDKGEQAALQAIVNGATPDERAAYRLSIKDLVKLNGTHYDVATPLLAHFIAQQMAQQQAASPTGTPARVRLDPAIGVIELDGRIIRGLDAAEYQLFTTLYAKRNQPLTPRELLAVLLQHTAQTRRFPGNPEERLDRYMEELMDKVNRPNRRYIEYELDGSYRFKE